jgi:hypothetical protein
MTKPPQTRKPATPEPDDDLPIADVFAPVAPAPQAASPAAPEVTPLAPSQSNSANHNAQVLAAELTRQNAMVGVTTQSPARAADIAFFRAAKASALANGISPAQYIRALQELGVGGQ